MTFQGNPWGCRGKKLHFPQTAFEAYMMEDATDELPGNPAQIFARIQETVSRQLPR
jgi:hypothetical protein